jgi:predicted nuclease of predicted toxin-antitoxin system
MRVLIDAQLPRRMVGWLTNAGCNALHTLDLPDGNRSTDEQIIEFADREQRAVVSKDEDLVNSHLLSARPAKLLLVSTGNISNRELENLMVPLLPSIVAEFRTHAFLELGRAGLVVRG